MKDIEEFVKTNVKITKQSNGEFGYFPLHCFVEKADGHIDFIVVAGVNSVEDCYKLIAMYVASDCKRIYFAIDFPAGGDMATDFVAVLCTENGDFSAFVRPYNSQTGAVYKRVPHCRRLMHIVRNMRDVSLGVMFKDFVSQN